LENEIQAASFDKLTISAIELTMNAHLEPVERMRAWRAP
jgi:hypothetical protein